MKTRGALLVLIAGLIFFSHQAMSDMLGTPKTYGPYVCEDCVVGYPVPDAVTASIIKWVEDTKAPVLFGLSPGDKVIVCNTLVCVTYVQTDDEKYYGEKRELRSPPPSGGGGGSPPPILDDGSGGSLGGCYSRTVKACTSAGSGGSVCEYHTFMEC